MELIHKLKAWYWKRKEKKKKEVSVWKKKKKTLQAHTQNTILFPKLRTHQVI